LGNYTQLINGMTVTFGAAPLGTELGRIRYIQMDVDFPTNVMIVSRYSQGIEDGQATVPDNCYVTVWDEFRVWAKIPWMLGAVINKDTYYPAFGRVEKPIPKANAGTGVAATAVGGYHTVTMDGSKSFAFSLPLTPPLTTVTSYAWDPADGVVVSGGLNAAVVTLRFTVGFRYVKLRVTGGDFGKEHIMAVPVYIHDPNSLADESITSFQIVNHMQTRTGQEIAIDFLQAMPRNVYPDGCLMMLWDDAIPVTATQRHNIQFIGWHQRDEAYIRAESTGTLHGTHMVFFDVCKRLETLPGFSQVVEYKSAPTQWTQTNFPNAMYYLWYLLYWHSSALEVADFLVDRAADLARLEFIILGSDQANLYSQVNDLAAMLQPDYMLVCSRQGQMRIIENPQIQATTDGVGAPNPSRPNPANPADQWGLFDDSRWTEIHYSYTRPPRVNQIRTMAVKSTRNYVVVAGKNTIPIIACVAPGDARGQGTEEIENSNRLVNGEAALYEFEGHRFAYLNRRYGPFLVTIPWEKFNQAMDVFDPKWMLLTISDINRTERELPTSIVNKPGQVLEIVIQYDYQETGLLRTVVVTWEEETRGPRALPLSLPVLG
jgi:hypothetical protein